MKSTPVHLTAQRDRGQSTVEFALLLPMLVFVMLAIFQVAIVARDQIAVAHAARVAARHASVDPDRSRAGHAAREVLAGVDVTVRGASGVGSLLTVVAEYHERTSLPLVGTLFPDPILRSKVVIRSEQ